MGPLTRSTYYLKWGHLQHKPMFLINLILFQRKLISNKAMLPGRLGSIVAAARSPKSVLTFWLASETKYPPEVMMLPCPSTIKRQMPNTVLVDLLLQNLQEKLIGVSAKYRHLA